MQTIYTPLPSWTSHSNFAMEKQARSASSPKRKINGSVQTLFPPPSVGNLQGSPKRHALRPSQCRTTTEWNESEAMARAADNRAAGDAVTNDYEMGMCRSIFPSALRPGCTVKRLRNNTKQQASLGSTKRCRNSRMS